MKQFVSSVAALLICATALAQQAIWGGSPIVSPEISGSGTVTFRLFAPQASKVEVTGDFLPPAKISTPGGEYSAPGTAAMTKGDDGIWTFTTAGSLAPELYGYAFIVDGVRMNDPSNVFQIRDVNTITSVFIISGDRASLYEVKNVPHGTVSKLWYHSDRLGTNRRLTVYTPAGYEDGEERYPVFYLLHGMGGDENAWSELGRAAQILDNMIASGEVKPMIVVMPNGNADLEAAPGESSLGFKQPTTQLPRTMEGSFEEAFPEILGFVDGHFRTVADMHHRAIAGLSMGGFHALHISNNYPATFDYVGLFSAAIVPHEKTASSIYENFNEKLKKQFEARPALYWISIGSDDFLYKANKDFIDLLAHNGYPYTYYETGEGHIWKNWRIYLTKFLPLLFK